MTRGTLRTAWLPAAAAAAILLVTASRDGYFRDEFYYLACARRLAWGYVDHPPLSVFLLSVVRQILGDGLMALRSVAAAVHVATIILTVDTARRLGAGSFGQTLAAVASALAPGLLAIATFYSMNVLDVLFWTIALRVLIEIADDPRDSRWVALGVVLGLGLLNKMSVLWLGAGIGAGLLLTPARRLLLSRGPWMAAAIAGVIFLPHVLWQVRAGWPTAEFIREASRGKMLANPPLSFLLDQVMMLQPVTVPLWGAGLAALAFAPRFRRYRTVAIAVVTVAVILMLNGTSRSSYLLPVYPVLFAAGAAWWDTRVSRPALRVVAVVVMVLTCAITVPLAAPVLSTDAYVRYAGAIGMAPDTEEKHELGRLPQFFADRHGWDALVAQVAAVRDSLDPAERDRAVVLTGNYGEAGAIELLGRGRGLRPISGHNNYWFWGPGDASSPIIAVGIPRERLQRMFDSVEEGGRTSCGDCMPYENGRPILVCRGPRQPVSTLWLAARHYN